MSNGRWVMHLDMDAFFASVEQLTRPTLRGRPVLVGGLGGRGVVAGASYEARVFGARSAMPIHQARRLVGMGAVVLPPRGSVYRVASRRVFGVVRDIAGTIEMLSFDEAFAEPEALAGVDGETASSYAEALRARIRTETGLTASVGLGNGKQVAKIASGMAKPDGVVVVPPGAERAFLAPLSVRKLWGIGPVAGDRLAKLGIETIGDLAALSDVEVIAVLGATHGPALVRLARGVDERPIATRAEAKQISAESTFEVDIVDAGPLRAAVEASAESAHRRLVADGRGARTVTVKLKLSDMSVLSRSATLAAATTDLATLVGAARRVTLDPREIGPIRLVGVGYSGLSAVEQFSLFPEFDAPDADPIAAEQAPQPARTPRDRLHTGRDVHHPEHGHGWVQGAGHGVVTVRFETRTSGPGRVVTFDLDDPALEPADPLVSLDWPDDPDD